LAENNSDGKRATFGYSLPLTSKNTEGIPFKLNLSIISL
jgi:hypothetical protein